MSLFFFVDIGIADFCPSVAAVFLFIRVSHLHDKFSIILIKNLLDLQTKILTYHSATEWTSSKANMTVCRPSFPYLSSLIHVLESQLSELPKTISHSLFLVFSSSSRHSSPIPMAAAENHNCFNC